MEIFNNTTKVVKDDLEKVIQPGSRISIAAACFSIYAYQLLRIEFSSDNQWGNGEFVAANLRLYAGDEEPPAF